MKSVDLPAMNFLSLVSRRDIGKLNVSNQASLIDSSAVRTLIRSTKSR